MSATTSYQDAKRSIRRSRRAARRTGRVHDYRAGAAVPVLFAA